MIPALLAARAKGYDVSVWYAQDRNGDLSAQYAAKGQDTSFSATTPEELLGLIAMWEVRGDDWQLKPGEADVWDRLLDAAPIYDPEGNVVTPP